LERYTGDQLINYKGLIVSTNVDTTCKTDLSFKHIQKNIIINNLWCQQSDINVQVIHCERNWSPYAV